MTDTQPNRDRDRTDDRVRTSVGRRTFIAVGGGVSATMLAGCASENSRGASTDDTQPDGSEGDGSAENDRGGTFELLISDMPTDIGDFDRLDVALDYARIFDGGEGSDADERDRDEDETEQGGDGNETEQDGDENETERDGGEDESGAEQDDAGDEAGESRENANDEDAETEPAGEQVDGGVERKRGFYILDLEGATVDLTEVIGDKAVPVFEGELAPGTYEKIELHVSEVDEIVDGERATVTVPSEKLQITHPFEVGADDPVSFVFDINVVKRGKGNDYNLKPVISESGVAGEDVEVENVDGERDDEAEDGSEEGKDADSDEGEDAESDAGNSDEEAGGAGENRDEGGDE